MRKPKNTHSYLPVWLKNGRCPGEKWHFRGCSREVYGYLKKLSENHGGFIFASIPQITKSTKKWKAVSSKCDHGQSLISAVKDGNRVRVHPDGTPCDRLPVAQPYKQREVKYVLRDFIRLGILGPRCVRRIHGREYTGWQFYPHANWTCDVGGICEFTKIEQLTEENCTADCTPDCTADCTEIRDNCTVDCTADCTPSSAIIEDKSKETLELQVSRVC